MYQYIEVKLLNSYESNRVIVPEQDTRLTILELLWYIKTYFIRL